MQQDVGQQTQKNPIACVIICLKWHINRTKSSDKKANNYCCPWHGRTAKKNKERKKLMKILTLKAFFRNYKFFLGYKVELKTTDDIVIKERKKKMFFFALLLKGLIQLIYFSFIFMLKS